MRSIAIISSVLIIGVAAFFVFGNRRQVEAPATPSELPDAANQKSAMENSNLIITSSAFGHNEKIPSKHTCDGDNIIPPLSWTGVPPEAKSLVLIMDDPDIPDFVKKSRGIEVFNHWVVFNIPTTITEIKEGVEPIGAKGNNSAGKTGYIGPCPPDREHRYFFKLYSLDTELGLSEGASKQEVEAAMEGHILAAGELVGLHNRQK